MVKDAQVRVLRRKLMEGKTQEAAAAGAGMSVGSARKWRAGLSPSQARKRHWWRNRPDPFAGAICADQVAFAWELAMLHGAATPPAQTAPGIAYMAEGGVHYEDAAGNVLMEHELHHSATSRRVREPAHWMLIWPYDPAATGLPTKENGAGSYIMFAGTPWAHVMIYQDPNKLTGSRGM